MRTITSQAIIRPSSPLVLLLLALMLLPSHLAYGQNETVIQDKISYELDKVWKTAKVVDCDESLEGEVTIPDTIVDKGTKYLVNTIGNKAFYGCHRIAVLRFPKTIEWIGAPMPFANLQGLQRYEMEGRWTYSIDGILFRGLADSQSNVLVAYPGGRPGEYNIPETVVKIDEYAFYNCIGLTLVRIPTSVTNIDRYAFAGCTTLTSVEIPASVRTIDGGIFVGCTGLTQVTLPATLLRIGSSLDGCTNLAKLVCLATTPPETNPAGIKGVSTSLVVYVPPAAVATYRATEGWNMYDIRPLPAATRVVIDGGLGDMVAGEDRLLHARVEPAEAAQSVTWGFAPGFGSKALISSIGVLHPTAAPGSVTVRATSVVDTTLWDDAVINIKVSFTYVEASPEPWRIGIEGRTILLHNAEGERLELYNLLGTCLHRSPTIDASPYRLSVPQPGIYILRIGNTTRKVAIN